MRKAKTLALFCMILIVACGCGPLRVRSTVPTEQLDVVRIDGYESIRFWGDQHSEGLEQTFLTSWAQERAVLGLESSKVTLPSAHYLAISGGGSNGAFGAGILCGWSKAGDRPTFKVVTGISTGALTAPFAFLGSDYDAALREVYTTVNQSDIAIFQGIVTILRGDSAYSTAPLSRLAEKYYTAEMLDRIAAEHRKGRRLLIGTTHLDAQRPMIWDMGAIACSDREDRVKLFRQVLLASSAIPAAFPPVYISVKDPDGHAYDEMHVDGGVTREMFLLPSEQHIYELRSDAGIQRRSHLYIIRNARIGPEFDRVAPRIGAIAERSISTLIKSQATGDLLTLYYEAKLNDIRYAVTSIPNEFADDSKSMFDQKYMSRLFDLGYTLAVDGKAWRDTPFYNWQPATRPTPRDLEAQPRH